MGEKSNGMPLKAIGITILVAVVVLAVILLNVMSDGAEESSANATFVVKKGSLTISVLETGTIKAREQVIIKNEVEGRTSIISLVSEGTHVKKGDLLVELDASTLVDNRIDQEIRVQNAEAAHINATESLAVVENQAQSDIDVALLTLEFAKQDLEQYKEGQFPIEQVAAENEIALRDEELKRANETLDWSRKLHTDKFISSTELQADELAVTRAENNLVIAKNNLKLLQKFTYHRNIAQLESDFRQAKMALERTNRKAKANIIQAKADLNAKKQEFKRQEDKLAKLEDQIKKARIVAPTDGMVVYATSAQRGSWRRESRTPLDEGVEVFERQELIYLPTASSAMAEVDIHEASLKKVRVGLPAVITVDALPGKRFVGTVGRIAPLPDAQSMWMNPDLKVYNSDIYLEGEDPALRTGMSCKVEIVADQYDDVVYIPIQAVIRIAGKPTVFVAMDGNRNGPFEECEVEIGLDNNRMVHITSGLSEGEIVMLTPPLKSATIDSGSRLTDDDSTAVTDGLKATISEKLEQVNGVEQVDPGVPGDPAKAEPGGEQRGRPSKEQMEEMRRRFENMSPEEKKKAMEKFRGGGQDPEGRSGRGGRRRPDDSGKDG